LIANNGLFVLKIKIISIKQHITIILTILNNTFKNLFIKTPTIINQLYHALIVYK